MPTEKGGYPENVNYELGKEISVTVICMTGYKGLKGNEEADILEKEGANRLEKG